MQLLSNSIWRCENFTGYKAYILQISLSDIKTSKGGEALLKNFELCLGMNTGIGFIQQNILCGFRNGPMNESGFNGSMENIFYQVVGWKNFFKTG